MPANYRKSLETGKARKLLQNARKQRGQTLAKKRSKHAQNAKHAKNALRTRMPRNSSALESPGPTEAASPKGSSSILVAFSRAATLSKESLPLTTDTRRLRSCMRANQSPKLPVASAAEASARTQQALPGLPHWPQHNSLFNDTPVHPQASDCSPISTGLPRISGRGPRLEGCVPVRLTGHQAVVGDQVRWEIDASAVLQGEEGLVPALPSGQPRCDLRRGLCGRGQPNSFEGVFS